MDLVLPIAGWEGIFPGMSTFDDVGVIIHVLRVVRGLSQGDLARLSGVRNSSISNYERGKSIPKLDTLEKLAQGLGLPVSAMESTREFIHRMRSRAGGREPSLNLESGGPLVQPGAYPQLDPDALRAELDRLSADAGRVASEILRLALGLLASSRPGETSEPRDPPASTPPSS